MARTLSAEAVTAKNTFNALANEVEGHLLRLLSGWQGRKAWKVSGSGGMVAQLRKEFDQYCDSHGYNISASQSPCPSWLTLYSQHGQVICHLRHLPTALKAELYLGRIDDAGVLLSLSEGRKRRTDYTPQEVAAVFERAYSLECEARELRSSMRDFDR